MIFETTAASEAAISILNDVPSLLISSSLSLVGTAFGTIGGGTTASASSLSTRELTSSRDYHLYFSGTVIGIGLTICINAITDYFRVTQRCKLFLRSIFNNDSNVSSSPQFQYAMPVVQSNHTILTNGFSKRKGKIVPTTDGTTKASSIKCIVSPYTTITSSLQVSVITLAPGYEIHHNRATAVEFYVVLSGVGLFSQQGVVETKTIQAGDGFVVSVGNMRWIANKCNRNIHTGTSETKSCSSNATDLILIRATDGGMRYNKSSIDTIRLDPYLRDCNAFDRMRKTVTTADTDVVTTENINDEPYTKSNSSSSSSITVPTSTPPSTTKGIPKSLSRTNCNITANLQSNSTVRFRSK